MKNDSKIRISFNEEPRNDAKIKVIGVGGGGGNAVNRKNSLTISPAKNCCVLLSRRLLITDSNVPYFYELRTTYVLKLC